MVHEFFLFFYVAQVAIFAFQYTKGDKHKIISGLFWIDQHNIVGN